MQTVSGGILRLGLSSIISVKYRLFAEKVQNQCCEPMDVAARGTDSSGERGSWRDPKLFLGSGRAAVGSAATDFQQGQQCSESLGSEGSQAELLCQCFSSVVDLRSFTGPPRGAACPSCPSCPAVKEH